MTLGMVKNVIGLVKGASEEWVLGLPVSGLKAKNDVLIVYVDG